MPGAYLYGWDAANTTWVKCLVNAEGKLIIDPTEIFENSPTNDEHGKAPDSDWAHDHDADVDAHHAKYTDAEAEAAINADADHGSTAPHNYFSGSHDDLSDVSAADHHARYTDSEAQSLIDSHAAISDAHHAKYTDAEAQDAINTDADHGSSAPHNYFSGSHPDLSNVTADQHHAKYTDTEAVAAVNAETILDPAIGNDTNECVRIQNPGGGANYWSGGTGAIQIKCPGANREMITLTIKIFSLVSDASFTVVAGGYLYTSNETWHSEFAQIIGTSPPTTSVRFGRNSDSSEWYIIIGDTDTAWNYSHVAILEVTVGYNATCSNWDDGWQISFITILPANVDKHISDARVTSKPEFPSGTKMLFKQNSAPSGWAFVSEDNDRVILNTSVESYGGDTGGSWTISGLSGTVAGHTLSVAEMPSHNHPIRNTIEEGDDASTVTEGRAGTVSIRNDVINDTGGGSGHSHGFTASHDGGWRPSYVKVITCSKD